MSKDSKTLGKVVQIDEARIQDHQGRLARGTVEETLNSLLEAEAARTVHALEDTETRQVGRAGRGEDLRDADLLPVSTNALDLYSDQRSAGADHTGDPAAYPRGRRIRGRAISFDAGCGAPEVCRRNQMRYPTLFFVDRCT